MITDNGKSVPDEVYVVDPRLQPRKRPENLRSILLSAYDRGQWDGVRVSSILWSLVCMALVAVLVFREILR